MRRSLTLLGVAICVAGLTALLSGSRQHTGAALVPVAQAQGHPAGSVPGHGCSAGTLKGTFGYRFSGAAVVSGFDGSPGAVVGLMTFDGKGHLTATATANANGTVRRSVVKGTYNVNQDCTGSLSAAAVPVSLLTFEADGVIVSDGTEVLFIGTIPELVFSGVAKKL